MNKKRLIITSVISIILVSVLFVGSTYSIFTSESVDENANVYTTGVLDVTYTISSDNIKLEDATPIANYDNVFIKPYRLTITNNGSVPYKFNVILNNTTSTTSINSNYIMAQVGKLEPVILGSTTNNIIKSDVVVESNSSVDIDARVYIKEDIPNSEIGKNFSATLSIDGLAVYNNSGTINNDDLIAIYEVPYEGIAYYVRKLYYDGSNISTINIGDNKEFPTIKQNATQKIMLDNYGNYRYYGKNPDNYVKFNDELWRIIGVFEVEDGNSIASKKVKLIRNERIGSFSYDSGTTISSGVNDYTTSDIMNLLNSNYNTLAINNSLYWNKASGNCYSGTNGTYSSCDFTTIGLGLEAKNMISDVKWYLGSFSDEEVSLLNSSQYDAFMEKFYAHQMYQYERSTNTFNCNTGNESCSRKAVWVGKVGLMYPSDYMYATDLSVCFYNGISFGYSNWERKNLVTSACYDNDWLSGSDDEWLLSPYNKSGSTAFTLNDGKYVFGADVSNSKTIRPVIYLNSNVKIVNGDGTLTNPYNLSLS